MGLPIEEDALLEGLIWDVWSDIEAEFQNDTHSIQLRK